VKGERQSETASGEAKYDEVRQKDNGKRTAREVSEV